MRLLRTAWEPVDRWLFGWGSPVTLGLLRILVGFWAFVNFAMIAPDFEAWFTERGYVPWALAERWLGPDPRLDVLHGVTNPALTALVFGGCLAAAVLVTVGLWTRPATIALALGVVSLHHRNPMILHGGDTVLRLAVIYLALAPCGRALSLDRWIALRKGKAPAVPEPVSLWPQRLFQVQLAVIYITTAWNKWGGHTWREGYATWYPLHLREFERFPVPDVLLTTPFLQLTTWGTLAVQLSLGTLVFYRPLRKWVLLAGLAMHGFIEWAFNIPLFAFLICSLYVAHYDGVEVSRWLERRRRWLPAWRRRAVPRTEPRRESMGDGVGGAVVEEKEEHARSSF